MLFLGDSHDASEFIANVQREKDEAVEAAEKENEKRRITGVLDPITSTLVDFQDADDLVRKMDAMWDRLDADGSGGLNYSEFKHGIRNLPGTGRIHMTMDDFDIVTESLPYPTHGLDTCNNTLILPACV
jgi:hypothetical protein